MPNHNHRKQQEGLNRMLEELAKLSDEMKRLEQEVQRLENTKTQLGAANQDLTVRLAERENDLVKTSAALELVIEKLKILRQPPNSFAHFLNFVDEDKKMADIIYDGRKKRVYIDRDVDLQMLLLGTPVIITEGTNAIVDIVGKAENIGESVALKRYVTDDLVLVEDQHGNKRVAYVSVWLNRQEATPESKVLFNNNFIWGVIESSEDSVRRAANQYLLAEVPDVEFDDIGGLDKELETIKTEIEDSFEVPKLYDAYLIPKESHVLLHGLPGNGKTMIAKAIAKSMLDKYKERIAPHASGNFFVIRGPELEVKWVGESERMLREVFDSAASLAKKAESPVFVFFDDCESFLMRRGAGISSDVNLGHVTQFLTLMEGVKEIRGVNVILASNRIDVLDPAVVSRMRLKIRIKEPDKDAAFKIFRKQLRKVPLHRKYNSDEFKRLAGDRERILDYVVQSVIDRLYGENKDNNFMEIVFNDDTSEIVKIHQLVSGRIIRDIVDRSKKIAKNKDKNIPESDWPTGVSAEDVLEALDIEFKSSEALPTTKETIQEWLKQKGITKAVEHTRKLFGERLGQRQLRYPVQ